MGSSFAIAIGHVDHSLGYDYPRRLYSIRAPFDLRPFEPKGYAHDGDRVQLLQAAHRKVTAASLCCRATSEATHTTSINGGPKATCIPVALHVALANLGGRAARSSQRPE